MTQTTTYDLRKTAFFGTLKFKKKSCRIQLQAHTLAYAAGLFKICGAVSLQF